MSELVQIKVAAVVQHTNRILLIQEIREAEEGPVWNIVRGSFDGRKDASLQEAVRREVLEETGLVPLSLIELPTQFYITPHKVRVITPFLVTVASDNPTPSLAESDEAILSYQWVPVDQLNQLLERADLVAHARETLKMIQNKGELPKRILLKSY